MLCYNYFKVCGGIMLFFLKASASVGESCLTVLGVVFFLRELLKVAYIVVPIGLIVMLSLDFAKGVINFGDSSGKVLNFVLRRVLYTLFIFLIPTVVFGLLNAIGATNNDSSSCWSYVDEVSVKEVRYILETQRNKLSSEIEEYRREIAQNANIKDKGDNLRRIVAAKSTSSATGSDSDSGVFVGKKYDLSYSELKAITALCVQEQGSAKGAAAEASLMANRFELFPKSCSNCDNLHDYVKNAGWWAKASDHMSHTEKATDKAVAAVKDVLVNGNRTLALYVDEHDCWNCNPKKSCSSGINGDICSITTNGHKYTSLSDITERSNYSKDDTVIKNVYSSTYTFYSFPTPGSDPFGYTENAKNKYNKLDTHGGLHGKF